MSEYKIAVYAIAKNEETFAARWAASMAEADVIVVLDTGSGDRTREILSACEKVKVYAEEISPWRFDTARNRSLALVPADADLCVCTDLDEVFEPGWRAQLEACLAAGATQVRCRYTWSFTPSGAEGVVYLADKIHARHGFTWKHPVHETVAFTGEGENRVVTNPGIRLYHHPDPSKSRAQYLPLLETAVSEDPLDDRNMHYLAREYYFYGRYEEAAACFQRHLSLSTATWEAERCASMRYLAKCFLAMGKADTAARWYLRACAEAPGLREPWLEYGRFCFDRGRWHAAIALIERALKITERPLDYISEGDSFSALPYDLLSLAYSRLGDRKNALKNADLALRLAPEDERIRKNRTYFEALPVC